MGTWRLIVVRVGPSLQYTRTVAAVKSPADTASEWTFSAISVANLTTCIRREATAKVQAVGVAELASHEMGAGVYCTGSARPSCGGGAIFGCIGVLNIMIRRRIGRFGDDMGGKMDIFDQTRKYQKGGSAINEYG